MRIPLLEVQRKYSIKYERQRIVILQKFKRSGSSALIIKIEKGNLSFFFLFFFIYFFYFNHFLDGIFLLFTPTFLTQHTLQLAVYDLFFIVIVFSQINVFVCLCIYVWFHMFFFTFYFFIFIFLTLL